MCDEGYEPLRAGQWDAASSIEMGHMMKVGSCEKVLPGSNLNPFKHRVSWNNASSDTRHC